MTKRGDQLRAKAVFEDKLRKKYFPEYLEAAKARWPEKKIERAGRKFMNWFNNLFDKKPNLAMTLLVAASLPVGAVFALVIAPLGAPALIASAVAFNAAAFGAAFHTPKAGREAEKAFKADLKSGRLEECYNSGQAPDMRQFHRPQQPASQHHLRSGLRGIFNHLPRHRRGQQQAPREVNGFYLNNTPRR